MEISTQAPVDQVTPHQPEADLQRFSSSSRIDSEASHPGEKVNRREQRSERLETARGEVSWAESSRVGSERARGNTIFTSPSGRAGNPEQIFDQIISRMRLQQLPGMTRLTVQLQPEHLGRVEIETVLDKDGMRAVIRVENHNVKRSVEAGLENLIQKLGDAGIELRQAEVSQFAQLQTGSGGQGQTDTRSGGESGREPQSGNKSRSDDFSSELASAETEAEDDGNVNYFA